VAGELGDQDDVVAGPHEPGQAGVAQGVRGGLDVGFLPEVADGEVDRTGREPSAFQGQEQRRPVAAGQIRALVEPGIEGVAGLGVERDLPVAVALAVAHGAAKTKFNLVAGTTWLFASPDLARAPVDVLVVDEAGQLSLADTLAACRSAGNLLLLGDPLQLPQVAQASHPGTSGGSALQHLLGDATTMPATRGVFLAETRRMHPDVCTFISDNIYESRLSSHTSCAIQATQSGTGLRWLRAEHTGCSTYAAEEVELVHAEIRRLLGTTWVDQHGTATPLTVRDFLVVAPYNDQVNLLRERLTADPVTRGVAAGSVDKFQGRQAAVVLFSMATSSSQHMPRSADFLFSRNRLNVAISRARCLAYLVCTAELLDSQGRDVEQMRLISTLCAFAASATNITQPTPLVVTPQVRFTKQPGVSPG